MSKHLIGLVWLVLLGGCSSVREESLLLYRPEVVGRGSLLEQKPWHFQGRLAVANQTDAISGTISWHHSLDKDEIELVGPLAQGRMMISIAADSVTIDDGESVQNFPGASDLVMRDQLGMDLPIQALKFWVLGTAEPNEPATKQEEGFYQQGWLVKYKEMQRVRNEILPKKLHLEKDGARIKLIVDQWDFT